MSTADSIFLDVAESPAQVAGWLADVTGFEQIPEWSDPEEPVLRGRAATADGWLGVVVERNSYALPDAGPDDVQAFDAYPIEIDIRYKPEEVLRREARLVFDKLVEARPDVPMLLVHELTILVAAHLPGADTQYFAEKITVDAPDHARWQPWVRS